MTGRGIEQGRDQRVEGRALFAGRLGIQQSVQLLAVQPRHNMQQADETAHQTMMIKSAREHLDAAALGGVRSSSPIVAGLRIQPAKPGIEGFDIGIAIRRAEEAEEAFMVGQMFQRRQFQPGQRDMIGIKVQGDDFGGAAAR